jgi:hypothetical protein
LSAAPPVIEDAALRRVIDHVATARATRTPLQLRGHGSKAFYGETPRGEPLDLTALAGIARYEPTELVVTVRAGTPIVELETALDRVNVWHSNRRASTGAARWAAWSPPGWPARHAPRSAACATSCSAPHCSTPTASCCASAAR